jgi:hypothetical protein
MLGFTLFQYSYQGNSNRSIPSAKFAQAIASSTASLNVDFYVECCPSFRLPHSIRPYRVHPEGLGEIDGGQDNDE